MPSPPIKKRIWSERLSFSAAIEQMAGEYLLGVIAVTIFEG
jgi:hypothetical protein